MASIDHVRAAPRDMGIVELIVRRPAVEQRELLGEAELDPVVGLVGDNWSTRGSSSTEDGASNPDHQITVMNVRATALVAGDRERWALCGDQLYVDFDLSTENVPAGTRLAIGDAVLEITSDPHLGCGKFARRFGVDALKLVNSAVGRELNLRGRNARVVTGGTVRTGDEVRKLGPV
jgi:hypothetical protein